MTFEKALEAMKSKKKVRRTFWRPNVFIGIDADNIIRNAVHDCEHGKFDYFLPAELLSSDFLADDWEIYEPQPKINEDAFLDLKFKPGKAFEDLWFVKVDKQSSDYAKIIRDKLSEEDSTMYNAIEITFKSGDTITYNKDEWDDYSYDGNSICVKKGGVWVGIYNFENVFSVELKK